MAQTGCFFCVPKAMRQVSAWVTPPRVIGSSCCSAPAEGEHAGHRPQDGRNTYDFPKKSWKYFCILKISQVLHVGNQVKLFSKRCRNQMKPWCPQKTRIHSVCSHAPIHSPTDTAGPMCMCAYTWHLFACQTLGEAEHMPAWRYRLCPPGSPTAGVGQLPAISAIQYAAMKEGGNFPAGETSWSRWTATGIEKWAGCLLVISESNKWQV